ncbi:MAG: AEC family transporter, partial [Armatimonadota bacterium]|nr:AEC family transporter [Armatimonadota bacterium]
MSLFLLTLRALAPLFLLILLGYGLKRARILHTAHVPVLNGVVVNLTLPALVVLGLARAPRLPLSEALLPLALLLAQLITLAAAYALGRGLRLPGQTLGATLVVGAFGNTGFLGYPMTLALLPARFPDAILLDQFGMTIMLYLSAAVIGARLGSGRAGEGAAGLPGQERAAILKFLRSPLFLSLVVGSLARILPWPSALLSL